MAKKDNDDILGKNSRKRLEELDKQWEKPVSDWDWGSGKFTLPDLRLLLEHHAPLQDLIRTLVALPAGVAPAALAQQTTELRERLAEEEDKRRIASANFSRMQSELGEAKTRCHALQSDLAQCNAATQQLLQAKGKLEKQLHQAQKDIDICHAELARSDSTPAELALLRQDAELAQRMELTDLPADDIQALIRVVAVLSQRDNLERLWDALKERCETQNRPASASERALLNSALIWCNHNWRTRPYTMIEAAPNKAYNFEQHLRSRNTVSGETIHDSRLPGIADGSHKTIRKILVSTQ